MVTRGHSWSLVCSFSQDPATSRCMGFVLPRWVFLKIATLLTPPFWVDHNLKQLLRPLSFSLQSRRKQPRDYFRLHDITAIEFELGMNLKFENCLIQSNLRIQRHIIAGVDSKAMSSPNLEELDCPKHSNTFSSVCERHYAMSNFSAGRKHLGLKIIFTSLHRDTQISPKNRIKMLLAIVRSNR